MKADSILGLILLEAKGRRISKTELAEKIGMNRKTFYNRLRSKSFTLWEIEAMLGQLNYSMMVRDKEDAPAN